VKLSGKRTAEDKTSGETTRYGHRRGKSDIQIADNLSGKRTGDKLIIAVCPFLLGKIEG
jgi:hypothetical protein